MSIQRTATEVVKSPEHMSDEKQLRELGVLNLKKTRLRGELIPLQLPEMSLW